MSDTPHALLDVPATAEYLRVDPRYVRRIIAERRIPFVRVGRLIRFRRVDLDAYIAAQTVPAAGDTP